MGFFDLYEHSCYNNFMFLNTLTFCTVMRSTKKLENCFFLSASRKKRMKKYVNIDNENNQNKQTGDR